VVIMMIIMLMIMGCYDSGHNCYTSNKM
jgi:hypothetical protein